MNFAGVSEIRALYVASVINGVTAPILLVVIMLVAGDRQVLGKFVPRRLLLGLGWATVVVMGLAALAMFGTLAWGEPRNEVGFGRNQRAKRTRFDALIVLEGCRFQLVQDQSARIEPNFVSVCDVRPRGLLE